MILGLFLARFWTISFDLRLEIGLYDLTLWLS